MVVEVVVVVVVVVVEVVVVARRATLRPSGLVLSSRGVTHCLVVIVTSKTSRRSVVVVFCSELSEPPSSRTLHALANRAITLSARIDLITCEYFTTQSLSTGGFVCGCKLFARICPRAAYPGGNG